MTKIKDLPNSILTNVVVKKRGRKSKKELEQNQIKQDNIIVSIEETKNNESNTSINESNTSINEILNLNSTEENSSFLLEDNLLVEETKTVAKKRGRKPKGGKIIQQIVPLVNNKETKPNVILHLKCFLKDLYNNALLNTNIESFNFASNKNNSPYEIINVNENNMNNTEDDTKYNKYYEDDIENDYDYEDSSNKNKENDIREIWRKLKVLEHNLHINNISDKKSACFWCTYDFDNPPIYIPKHYIKDTYHVYGCFCSPECSVAYLMEESIDSSSKFERYHLLNHIYSKIYDYKKNIKPAPNPYYMLEKYYGNLSIQEFRALLRNERLFLVVDKPLTRVLPELHEDNDDFIINNKIIPSNTYQIKKKLQKKQQSKNNILTEKFGLGQ
jgi:hypothetical protein